ncbi:uncharacterized protein LOC119066749 [Bradysia coprophila]|uniref:uncharacterized protein LOC119066749 n=1 Tax=Bradysia coprophila TaxID=38358 RepID=UPI00187DA2AB|nr:uncharacterized protein LOC119066749 [Bradysia coprophila]XP_037025275.1 uncharacterized protein LOC119066749 [Bradysia coprophila]
MMAKKSSEWSKLLGFTTEEFPVCIQELMSYCGYKALPDMLNIDESKLRSVESILSKNKKLTSQKYLIDYEIQTQDNSFIFYPAHREKILSIPSKYPWIQIRKPENASTGQKKKRNSTDLRSKVPRREINAKEKLMEQVKKLVKSNNGLMLLDDSITYSNIIEFNSSKDGLYVCRFKCPICEKVSSTKFETNWKTDKISDHFKSHDKYVNVKPEIISPNKSKLQGGNKLLRTKLVQKLANSIKSVGLTLLDKVIVERNITDLKLCKRDFSYECQFECPFCVESSTLKTGSKWNVAEISKHLKTHADNRKESMSETCFKEPKVVSSTSEQKAGTSSDFYANYSFHNQVLREQEQDKDSFHAKMQLTVFAHNVNGLRTKLSDVYLKARNNDYDIYIFTETGLDARIPNDAIFPSETFRVYRCDRSSETSLKKSGGGVLIAVNTRYDSRVIKRGDSHGCEQIYAEVKEGIRTLILGAIYIPPDSKIYELHMGIVTQIYDGFDENTTFILYGDFNLPQLTWTQTTPNTYLPTKITNNAGKLTTEICTRMGLQQINCVLNDNNRILDLVWTNRPENCVCYVSSSNFLKNESHHKAMRIEIGWNLNDLDEMNTVQTKEEQVECKPDINLLTDIDIFKSLDPYYYSTMEK